ncbi:MAG: DHHA1 domain-containing protein, partial [Candidatus Parcubacteria bacterium]|nr:DHHA1 domain-containing protein [Candidatus Parcubacteria bacterium]
HSDFHSEAFEKWLLDLVALGSVSDVMVLLGENRTIVKYGLIVLNKTNRLGLRVLYEESKITMGAIDTHTIYYQLGPRLNVASRLDHANTALALILSQDRSEAHRIARDLNRINSERQKMVDSAVQKLKADFGLDPKERIMIGYSPDWPVGILGLIAGKLRDEYQRPALALTNQDSMIVGSGRSNDQLNLVDLFIRLAPILSRYGGHRRAAGFAMDDVNKLKDFIAAAETAAQELMDKEILPDELLIEAEISVSDVTWDLQENLEQFAPFGEGNSTPLFLIKNLTIDNFQWLGQNDKHLKLVASGRKFIHFCADNECKGLRVGSKIDVVVEIGVNQWNGTKELQLKIVAIKIL